MLYRSVIGVTAAALSIAVPTEAAAGQSALDRAVQFANGQNLGSSGYRLKRASLALAAQPNDVAQPVSSEALPRDADQVTKSAAYKWEAGFLALSAVDAVETITCLDANRCTEGNPIWGRHPSTGKIIATKLGLGLVQFGIFKLIVDHDPHSALRLAQVSAVVQGSFVLLNLRHAF